MNNLPKTVGELRSLSVSALDALRVECKTYAHEAQQIALGLRREQARHFWQVSAKWFRRMAHIEAEFKRRRDDVVVMGLETTEHDARD